MERPLPVERNVPESSSNLRKEITEGFTRCQIHGGNMSVKTKNFFERERNNFFYIVYDLNCVIKH